MNFVYRLGQPNIVIAELKELKSDRKGRRFRVVNAEGMAANNKIVRVWDRSVRTMTKTDYGFTLDPNGTKKKFQSVIYMNGPGGRSGMSIGTVIETEEQAREVRANAEKTSVPYYEAAQ